MEEATDVLILAAKNLDNLRFQTKILSAMRMIWVKWSEDKFPVTSFKAEQFVINETENANQAKLEESGVTRPRSKMIGLVMFGPKT